MLKRREGKSMPVSEVRNVFNNFKTTQINPAPQKVVQNIQEDKFEKETSTNTTTKKKTIIAITAGITLLLAYLNRKAIMKLFKKTQQPEVKPQQPKSETQLPATKSENPVDQPITTPKVKVSDKYSYYDEYEKANNELIKFERKQREILNSGRVLTPEEVAERRQVKATRKAVLDKIEKENKSLVKIREDIKTKEERIEYIEQYVFDRMNISEASALDGLDAFERYGYRRPFRKETSDHTLSQISVNLQTLPKGHKTDKVLNRFLDIFEKTAQKDSKRYDDNSRLGYVVVDYIRYGTNIKKESIIRAIELMKKIADQKMDYKRIDGELYVYAKELYKDADIQKAMNELKEIVKDCPNVTRKSEQEWESMELKELW